MQVTRETLALIAVATFVLGGGCGSRTGFLDQGAGGPDGSGSSGSSGSGGSSGSSSGAADSSSGGSSGGMDAGGCAAGDSVCAGACVNEQTDPNNCGGCGVMCGGTCTGGRCLEVLDPRWAMKLALYEGDVYWTNAPGMPPPPQPDVVLSVATGGGPVATLASGQFGPSGIGVNAAGVYWTAQYHDEGLLHVPLGGGAVTTIAAGAQGEALAIDATTAYLALSGQRDGVMQVPLGGGTASLLGSSSAQFVTSGGDMAVDSSGVYVCSTGMTGLPGEPGGLVRVALSGGGVTTLASGRSASPFSVAIDATTAYWTEGAASAAFNLMSVPLGGGAPVTLASGAGAPYGIAVDDTNVYWTTWPAPPGSAVMKVPKAGGTPHDARVDPESGVRHRGRRHQRVLGIERWPDETDPEVAIGTPPVVRMVAEPTRATRLAASRRWRPIRPARATRRGAPSVHGPAPPVTPRVRPRALRRC